MKKYHKMKKACLLLLSILILNSCANSKEKKESESLISNILLTANEDKGTDEIVSFYGGKCEYYTGFTTSSTYGRQKYCEIKLSESEGLDEQFDNIFLPSSNIAYLLFKNLKEEKNKFDVIKVILISKENIKQEFDFPISYLEKVAAKIKIAEKTANLLKEKQFDEIKEMLNNEIYTYDKENMISKMIEVEPELGDFIEFKLMGFRSLDYAALKNHELIRITGVMERAKQDKIFSVDVDLNPNNNDIHRILYKL